jgi:hypothetical protein
MAAEGGREGSRTKATWQKERMKEEGKPIKRIVTYKRRMNTKNSLTQGRGKR